MMFINLISRYPLAPWYLLALTMIAIVISVMLKPAVVPFILTQEESEFTDVETTIESPVELITLVGNNRVSKNAADRKTITGQIFDTTDLIPLPGVSIQAKGTTHGTSTDWEGRFTLVVGTDEKTFVLEFAGYKSKEFKLDDRNKYVVGMTPEK